jgi:hypothetical protein
MAWIERRHLKQLSGGKEQFSYRVCWRDPKGRRRYETRPTRAAAEKYKRPIEHSQDVGAYRDPNLGKVMLDEFFRHHMETTSNLAPKTRDLYECQWRVHMESRLGQVRLNAMSKADVKSFLSGLREDGVPEMTVGAVHRLLQAVLSVAVDEGRISANPASRIRMPAPTVTGRCSSSWA